MGLNDDREMLDACKEQGILDERHIATLTEQVAKMAHRIAAIRQLVAAHTITLYRDSAHADSEEPGCEAVEAWRIEQILDRQEPTP